MRILAVGAHPDDLEFGCGAVLSKESRRGSSLSLVVCSRGEAGTNGTPEARSAEARAAAEQLGAAIRFLEMGGDGLIEPSKENALELAAVIRETRPQAVLCPTYEENQHPDHVAVARLMREACRLARYGGLAALASQPAWSVGSLLFYAIAPSGEPQRRPCFLIDVSSEAQAWEKLMRCHESQMQTRRYVDLQMARARSWGIQIGAEHAQALWSEDPLVVPHLGTLANTARSL